jgi:ankyrin repeat protein
VELLLNAGADVNMQGGEYGNALQAASFEGHEQVVQQLLDVGADVNVQGGGYHGNALQAASLQGYNQVVKLLLDNGAYMNAQQTVLAVLTCWAERPCGGEDVVCEGYPGEL